MAEIAAHPDGSRPRRGWILICVYPMLLVAAALFVAYPIVDLLARAAFVDGRLTASPIGRLLADSYNRQIIWNTLALGFTVAAAGTMLAALYAYAMTRVETPWKPVWHFIALLPTSSGANSARMSS